MTGSRATLRQSDELEELAGFCDNYRRLFVLTGAGCSTGCGIPDYRDAQGNWKRAQPIPYQDFVRSEHARRRYWARSLFGWPHFLRAQPGPAHVALAQLESKGYVLQLVTQNIDRLHQRAGSQCIIDLHGRLDTAECLGCGAILPRAQLQGALEALNPGFQASVARVVPDGDVELACTDTGAFRVPCCHLCGGILKPSVVFFGEAVPRERVQRALLALRQAAAVLVVGSSLMVFSGYRFCRAAAEQGKPIVAINLGRTRADDYLKLKVTGECGRALTRLVKRLGA